MTKKEEVRVMPRLRLITTMEIQASLISGQRERDPRNQEEKKNAMRSKLVKKA